MERIIDKAVLLTCCVVVAAFSLPDAAPIVALLLTVIVSALFEISRIPKTARIAFLAALLCGAVAFHGIALFLPLLIYDCFRTKLWALRLIPLPLPLLAAMDNSPEQILLVYAFTCVGIALSLRTNRVEWERREFQQLRDDLQERSLSLESKHKNLQDKQDLEVSLATLNERGRIAREIHDNVGHLLTRSVLQVEALQVVHQDDPQVVQELGKVGDTLNEALDNVRQSVRDLHGDSLDLRVQLVNLAESTESAQVSVEYDADNIPAPVGYCFSAVVREALSNVVHHSDADSVAVVVSEFPAFYRLSVHDNGTRDPALGDVRSKGASDRGARSGSSDSTISASGWSKGMGLQSMEDRTRALGGVFRVGFDKGFRIIVTIPKDGSGA